MAKRRTAPKKVVARNGGEKSNPPTENIAKAAFDLFARQGFNITTVRDIMHACGLTQGALYNHFSSKDQLLATIVTQTMMELEQALTDAVAAAEDGPKAQLYAFTRCYALRHTRFRTEALVANREFVWLEPTKGAAIRASRRRVRDMLIGILRRGVKAKVFTMPHRKGREDYKMTAMAILNMATDVSYWYAPGGPWSDEAVAELHADMALRLAGIVET